MGKQKMVFKLTMENPKKRAKAMKIAVGLCGVISAEVQEGKLVVVGSDEVDSVRLTLMLRKRMEFMGRFCWNKGFHVELDSVSAVKEEEKEKEKEKEKVEALKYTMAPQPLRWQQLFRRKYPDEILGKADARGKGDYQIEYEPAPRITEADKNNDRR